MRYFEDQGNERISAENQSEFDYEICGEDATISSALRLLVEEGRFEIVGGGLVQHDEALTSLSMTIDQLTSGNMWLMKTFPSLLSNPINTAYQIDSFGHSSDTASLFLMAGYENIVLNRISSPSLQWLDSRQLREFWWESPVSINGSSKRLFTHIIDKHYNNFPKMLHLQSDSRDCQRVCSAWEEFLREKQAVYRTRHALVLYGDDFEGGPSYFYEKLRKTLTCLQGGLPHIQFHWSTLSKYISLVKSELKERKEELTFRNEVPFLPYIQKWNNVWTGFYSSRPFLKKSIRRLEQISRAANIISSSLSNVFLERFPNDWTTEENNLNIMSHHDTITGTSKTDVIENSISILNSVSNSFSQKIVQMFVRSGGSSDWKWLSFKQNGSTFDAFEGESIRLLLFNPTEVTYNQAFTRSIRLSPHQSGLLFWTVKNAQNSFLPCQLTFHEGAHSADLSVDIVLEGYQFLLLQIELNSGEHPTSYVCTQVVSESFGMVNPLPFHDVQVRIEQNKPVLCGRAGQCVSLVPSQLTSGCVTDHCAFLGIPFGSGPYVLRFFLHQFFWIGFLIGTVLGLVLMQYFFSFRNSIRNIRDYFRHYHPFLRLLLPSCLGFFLGSMFPFLNQHLPADPNMQLEFGIIFGAQIGFVIAGVFGPGIPFLVFGCLLPLLVTHPKMSPSSYFTDQALVSAKFASGPLVGIFWFEFDRTLLKITLSSQDSSPFLQVYSIVPSFGNVESVLKFDLSQSSLSLFTDGQLDFHKAPRYDPLSFDSLPRAFTPIISSACVTQSLWGNLGGFGITFRQSIGMSLIGDTLYLLLHRTASNEDEKGLWSVKSDRLNNEIEMALLFNETRESIHSHAFSFNSPLEVFFGGSSPPLPSFFIPVSLPPLHLLTWKYHQPQQLSWMFPHSSQGVSVAYLLRLFNPSNERVSFSIGELFGGNTSFFCAATSLFFMHVEDQQCTLFRRYFAFPHEIKSFLLWDHW